MASPATLDIVAMCDTAQDADPLGLDSFFRRRGAVVERRLDDLLGVLTTVAREADGQALTPAEALAALRDIDFLLCAVELAEPLAYKRVPRLEPLLQELGSTAGHIPRGSVLTYGLCNPLDERMRLFTGRGEERSFVTELAAGMRGLDTVLRGLVALADHPVDSPDAVAASQRLEAAWEPMIKAAVAMLRTMPPEVFSGEIVSCFVPLDVGGACYQGVTGAQTLNVTIDYLLWGVESQDDTYRAYAQANLAEQLPPHRELVAHALDRTGGASILTHIGHQLAGQAVVRDPVAAETVLQHLESLLRRIGTFRTAHRRLADLNLPLRPTPTGSGGHTVALLELLTSSTLQARERARTLRRAQRSAARGRTASDEPTTRRGGTAGHLGCDRLPRAQQGGHR